MNTTAHEFEPKRIPSYDEIAAFDPDEFATAFQWAMNAVSGTALIRDPATLRISLPDEDGALVDYQIADRPETRVMMAMLERYGETDHLKYHSAVARIFALLHFVDRGGLEPWVSKAPGPAGDVYIHPCVIAAAAVTKLDSMLRFPVRAFMRQLRRIAADGGS